MSDLKIRIDDLSDGVIEAFLQEHLKEMQLYSPEESIHALDSSAIKHPSITYWSAWIGNEFVGCGALKEISRDHAEIKSMRTSKQHLRKGIAAKILSTILENARARFYSQVSLETGTNKAFLPARKLYEQFGFKECEPFGGYDYDPYSAYYTRSI